MAIKLFELGFILKAVDQLSGPLKRVTATMENMEATAKGFERFKRMGATVLEAGAVVGGLGAAIALPLKDAIEKADELEDHMARLATAIGNVPDKANQLAAAEKFVSDESIATGYDVNQLTESLYQGLSGFLNMQQSMSVATEAAKLARGTTGDLTDTTNALTTMMLNFGDATKTPIQNATMLADKMAALQTQFKFTNLGELTAAMREAGPVAMGLGVNLDQTLAALATLSAGGLGGGEGGTAFLEILTQMSKAARKLGFEVFAGPNGQGIDLFKTLQGIQRQFGDISKNKALAAAFEQAFGQRAGPRISVLLQHLDKFQTAMNGITNSAGATDRAFAEFNERGSLVFTRLHQAVTAIELSFGNALLPMLDKVARGMLALATHLSHFAEAHPGLMRFIAVFAALTAATLVLVGGLALLVGGIAFIGAVLAPVIGAIGLGGVAFAAIAVAAIAAASAIIAWWGPIKTFFTSMIPRAFEWGVNLLKTFAKGIASGAMYAVHAAEHVAKRIGDFFVGHSPSPLGPLHDLNRVRIIQMIAETMEPAPMLAAIRRVAAVTAIAMPMMIGAATMPAIASSSARGGSAPVVINLTMNYTMPSGASGDDFVKLAREHGREVAKIVEEILARKARVRFD